jgi:thiol:disulfide interchange protein DsbC
MTISRKNCRRSICTLLCVLLALFAGTGVYAFKDSGDCSKCHTLSEKEMGPILGKIRAPDAKVLDIRPAPVKGFWEVALDRRGQRFVIYVDFSKKFAAAGPLIELNTGKDRARERVAELNEARRIDMSKLSVKDALILGTETAPKRVFVFLDPD